MEEQTTKEYLPIVALRLRIGKETAGYKLAVARLLLREKLQRIEKPAVGHHLVVQVIAGGAPGGAEAADHFSAFTCAPFCTLKPER